jgi:Protein of unknown function (DUF1488)
MTTPAPFLHEASGCVRFWVSIGTEDVGATIRRETLHYHFNPHGAADDPLALYLAHADVIDEAVRRRVREGSREPVMLRDPDLHIPRAR